MNSETNPNNPTQGAERLNHRDVANAASKALETTKGRNSTEACTLLDVPLHSAAAPIPMTRPNAEPPNKATAAWKNVPKRAFAVPTLSFELILDQV
jgi:hypothetical protein